MQVLRPAGLRFQKSRQSVWSGSSCRSRRREARNADLPTHFPPNFDVRRPLELNSGPRADAWSSCECRWGPTHYSVLLLKVLGHEVSSVIRASEDSFRVSWTERRYVDEALAATERWSAILTIVLETPTDADRLKKNPLGVYIHALNWSKELG